MTLRVQTDELGRNQPCPCGSGKKHKRCCLPKQYGFVPTPEEIASSRVSYHHRSYDLRYEFEVACSLYLDRVAFYEEYAELVRLAQIAWNAAALADYVEAYRGGFDLELKRNISPFLSIKEEGRLDRLATAYPDFTTQLKQCVWRALRDDADDVLGGQGVLDVAWDLKRRFSGLQAMIQTRSWSRPDTEEFGFALKTVAVNLRQARTLPGVKELLDRVYIDDVT